MAQGPDDLMGADTTDPGGETESGADTAAIRDDIERTRLEMTGTIDAIQDRLSPTAVKEQVMEEVRGHLREAKNTVREATIGKVEDFMATAEDSIRAARRGVVTTVRENPVPAVLVGVGLGWLITSGLRGSSTARRRHGYGGARPMSYGSGAIPYANQRQEPGMLERSQRLAGESMERARSMASDAVETVQESANELVGATQESMESMGGWLQDTMEENPFAVGVAVLAAGAIVGMSIPRTRRENQLMGETRDQLLDGAQHVASETMRQVRDAADRITDRLEDSSRPDEVR